MEFRMAFGLEVVVRFWGGTIGAKPVAPFEDFAEKSETITIVFFGGAFGFPRGGSGLVQGKLGASEADSTREGDVGMVSGVGTEGLVGVKGKFDQFIPSSGDKEVIAACIDKQ